MGDILGAIFLFLYGIAFVTIASLILIAPVVLIIYTMVDVFHRDDLGVGKLIWTLVIILVPFLGLAVYWLAKPVATTHTPGRNLPTI